MGSNNNREAVLVAYGRSAIARASKGALRGRHPAAYAAEVLEGVLRQLPQLDYGEIEDLVLGCAKPEQVQGSNLGRVVAQRAGLPDTVAGQTVNRFCASGLQAIATAANSIMTGQAEVLIAGGVESMTAIPMGIKEEYREEWLSANRPGLYMPMGMTAENVAGHYGITREQMERFALASHQKAAAARREGRFRREIIPVTGDNPDGIPVLLEADEGIRENGTMETLAAMKPCFREDGQITAATSSQTSDGAAFVVLMSADKARRLGLRPIARFAAYAVAGVPADMMGTGPILAVPKAMRLAGWSPDDLDVIELNEAFAAQALPCMQELGLREEIVNPRGGAIALGHPLGATGAILTCKALSYLQDTGGSRALVMMCVGGGMGAAGLFEVV